MKQNFLKTLLVCLLTFAGTAVFAYDCEVNGIYYDLNAEDQTASVTYGVYLSASYSGVVDIPDNVEYGGVSYAVTSLGSGAFFNCSELTKVTLPNSLTFIGDNAFGYCRALTELAIPASVTAIDNFVFTECNSLAEIVIPRSVTSIGTFLLSGCDNLEKIIVEEGNPRYDSRENCNAIIDTDAATLLFGCKTTRIPSNVTSIGNNAFDACRGLAELTIPASITSIGDGAFYGCASLEKIVVEEGNPCFDSREDCNAVIRTDGEEVVLAVGCKNTRIPTSVTAIGNYAFYGCTGLTEFTIPGHVTSIGHHAFYGCNGLTKLLISEGVVSIADQAFTLCNRLTTLDIPNSVTHIGDNVFLSCRGLTEIVLRSGLTSIGTGAFRNCSALVNVFSINTTPPQISSDTFDSYLIGSSAVLHVPTDCKPLYEQAEGWQDFSNIREDINIPSGIESVAAGHPQSGDIYTLDGVKCNTTSLPELPVGIYIVNGKKVCVK